MTRLLIVGPPGAGKGTQGVGIAAHYGVPVISTGDIFRANIKGRTPLGLQVEAITASGAYVPDELTNNIVADRLTQADAAAGFLLDGYPRTIGQLSFLDELLAGGGTALDAVIELTADVDELVARLMHRAQEQGRADDSEEVIRKRHEIYWAETAPLIDVFASRGLLVRVDGLGEMEAVAERIREGLAAAGIAGS